MNRRQRLRRTRTRQFCLLGPLVMTALIWAIGILLPARHSEEARMRLGASAETVWAVLTDLDRLPDWRRDLRRVERLPDAEGQVRWLEVRLAGRAATYRRVESVSPRRLVIQSSEPNCRWVYQIRALDWGSELAVREERTIANPLARTFAAIFGDRDRVEGLTGDLRRRLTGRGDKPALRLMD